MQPRSSLRAQGSTRPSHRVLEGLLVEGGGELANMCVFNTSSQHLGPKPASGTGLRSPMVKPRSAPNPFIPLSPCGQNTSSPPQNRRSELNVGWLDVTTARRRRWVRLHTSASEEREVHSVFLMPVFGARREGKAAADVKGQFPVCGPSYQPHSSKLQ